ncbi:MAG: hypothetical protein P3B98_04880 [Gemmatimonadota bacterium]|nr:hypothetical protein [Gemmatimonadota bacterium]
MRSVLLVFAVALLALSAPSSAAAQSQTAVRPSLAPVAARASVGVQRIQQRRAPVGQPAPFRQDTRQNRALMIVGGAGMLTGAVIGGDGGGLISVGGAVVFLWGLYQYLQ